MKKFSSIGQFRNVVTTIGVIYNNEAGNMPTLDFEGTVKLHGSNCSIRRENGEFFAQSRSKVLTFDHDNFGFNALMLSISVASLNELFDKVDSDPAHVVTIFGERIGKGIQSKVGIAQLEKQWVIFGAFVSSTGASTDEYDEDEDDDGDDDGDDDDDVSGTYVAPQPDWEIEDFRVYSITRLPKYKISINFNNPAEYVDDLTQLTLNVEKRCPWAAMFGVEGIGEGIVWKAAASPFKSNLWFKVKGSEHVGSARNSGPKVVTNVCPERVQSMGACVDIVLTEGRLIQGLEYLKENNIAIEMSNLGAFLKWIGQDVVKEEADTISANGFTWKDVSPSITRRAKTFFTKSISSF